MRRWTWIVCDLKGHTEFLARSVRTECRRPAGSPRRISSVHHRLSHPSLRFKKLAGHENLWSVRVTLSVRAVGARDGDTVVWVWIGSHNEFDNKFG